MRAASNSPRPRAAMRRRPSEFLLAFSLILAALPVAARESDREQPMDIAADDIDAVLEDTSESRLTGNVLITQGTLRIAADGPRGSATITRVDGEFRRMVLEGEPAS